MIIMMLYQIADSGKKSGRAGGNVYMRNGRVRSMTVPRLVRNSFTTGARAILSSFSAGWNALTESQRESWNQMNWATKSDRFGNTVPVTGKAAYVQLNTNLDNIGTAPLTDAPLSGGGAEAAEFLTNDVADQSTGTVIASGVIWTSAGTNKIFATPPTRAGVSRPKKSAYRMIGGFNQPGMTAAQLTTAYEAKYGTSWKDNAGNVGGKIYFQAYGVNETTGLAVAGNIGFSVIQA